MANILKENKTYTDVRGVVYGDAYMVVDSFMGNKYPTPRLSFTVQIYKDQAAQQAGNSPVYETGIIMETADIAVYLGTPKDAADQEIPTEFARKHIYLYLGTEQPEIQGVVWGDWISDVPGGVPQTLNHK